MVAASRKQPASGSVNYGSLVFLSKLSFFLGAWANLSIVPLLLSTGHANRNTERTTQVYLCL